MGLYKQVKGLVGNIGCIYRDGNSCYESALKGNKVIDRHVISKRETHLIESSNSSIRDNLGRLNRRGKRFSKSWCMLDATLLLFFHRSMINTTV